MKKIFILLLSTLFCVTSCYDDSELRERLDMLERVTKHSIQGSISQLEDKSKELKSEIEELEDTQYASEEEITQLKSQHQTIEKKIKELKSWMEDLLSGYYTAEEIDKQVESMNELIESTSQSINESIAQIQEKLEQLTKKLQISFEGTDIGIVAGGTAEVSYKIEGAGPLTVVKALGQNGWSAKVHPLSESTGTIIVKAPDPLIEDEIVVIVYNGEYRTIMSSINFVTGIITPSQEAYELPRDGGKFTASISTNLDYKIGIPHEYSDWISSPTSTRAMRTDRLTFNIAANKGYLKRIGTISLSKDDYSKTIKVIQAGKKKLNLVMTHKASTLDFPDWSGNEMNGFITWDKGMAPEEYTQYFSHNYGSTAEKETRFEMYGANSFTIEDMTNVSHLSISFD